MSNKLAVFLTITFTLGASASAQAESCTKKKAIEAVKKACSLIEKKGEKAIPEITKARFCGPNYVWIQDSDVKMIMHPIKPRLNGTSLLENVDEEGTKLFVEFDKKAKANPKGGWVDYLWAKPKAEKATPKTSFVKMCKGKLGWIAGSGVWKDELK